MRVAIENFLNAKPGEILETTARYKKSNGEYIWVYSRKLVYKFDENDNPSVFISMAENVSEMVNVVSKLHEKTEQLKLVSYKNSHETRAPIASIIGLLDLIEEEHITSEHNLKIFIYLKHTISKLDEIIREINEAAEK